MVLINEQEKYDFSEMIEGNEIHYDFEMIFELNANAAIEGMKSYNEPKYYKEDIIGFTKVYNFEGKSRNDFCSWSVKQNQRKGYLPKAYAFKKSD